MDKLVKQFIMNRVQRCMLYQEIEKATGGEAGSQSI